MTSEESEMREASLSLVNRNLVITKEVPLLLLLEKEDETRKRETHEKEEDEETGDRVDRSNGRGRRVQRFVGGRESKRKKKAGRLWEDQKGERGESCCSRVANSMRVGKSATSSFDAILTVIRGN